MKPILRNRITSFASLNWLLSRTLLSWALVPRTLVLWALLPLGLLLTSPSYSASTSAEVSEAELYQQLQELNQRYEKLKKQIEKNKGSSEKSLREMKKQEQALQFRGFFSAGVATTDGKAALRKLNDNQNIGDEPNFQSDSIVGLQLDATINNKARYTHQMTTAGFDINHKVITEWAYFSYKPYNDTTIKVGRLRIPFSYSRSPSTWVSPILGFAPQ